MLLNLALAYRLLVAFYLVRTTRLARVGVN